MRSGYATEMDGAPRRELRPEENWFDEEPAREVAEPAPAPVRGPAGSPDSTPLPSAAEARRIRLPVKRIVFFVAAIVGLYIVWPQLVKLYDALPGLTTIRWYWFALMIALEVASFGCYWGMMRVTLGEPRWFVVATTNLIGTAFSRVVPGGAASGGTMSYQILAAADVPKGRAVTGLTATTLLSTAVLFLLPLLSAPAVLGGAPVDPSLLNTLLIGVAIAVLIVAVGALVLFTDRPLRAFGRLAGRFLDRVRKAGAPRRGLPDRLVAERDLIKDALGDRWWQALPCAAGNWLFDFAALLAALAAVGASPRPSLVLVGYVVAILLGQIPLTPGGIGFVEVGLAATLGLAGVGGAEATAAALAYRLVSFWGPIPAGAVAGLLFRRRFPGTRSRADDSAPAAQTTGGPPL